MTTVATNPMMALYGRLRALGLAQPYLQKNILPSWWDDEIAATPAGHHEAMAVLSRHLGLDIGSLRDSSAQPQFSEIACKFKKTSGTDEAELNLARNISVQVAKLAAATMSTPVLMPESAQAMRQQILAKGNSCVDLNGLVSYCWDIGIPVIYVSEFPEHAPVMHGLAALIDDRPVVVIARRRKQSAWLLFDLAHELGHLVLKHVVSNQVLIDEQVAQDDSSDQEEVDANRFAVALITGNANKRVTASDRWPSAIQLAQSARRQSFTQQIDPGHIVLNYAHCMGKRFWPVATAALKILEPHGRGPEIMRQQMADRLDWSALSSDDSEFIASMTRSSGESRPS